MQTHQLRMTGPILENKHARIKEKADYMLPAPYLSLNEFMGINYQHTCTHVL